MINLSNFFNKNLKKAACVAIFNNQNKLLLLRRSETSEWMPFHYCFPGGHMEENEKPIDAAERETYEETEIELDKNNMKLETIEENNGYINYIFSAKVPFSKSKLNFEHDKYVWCDFEDCKNYNLVPKLHQIITELKNKGCFQ